jgi:hypothetical protein
MACTWSPMLVYAVFGQAKWAYMSDILRLKRPIRLYVPICTTYCPFCRHIPENAPIRSTPRFCQRSLKIGRQAFPAARPFLLPGFASSAIQTVRAPLGRVHFTLGLVGCSRGDPGPRRVLPRARCAPHRLRALQRLVSVSPGIHPGDEALQSPA